MNLLISMTVPLPPIQPREASIDNDVYPVKAMSKAIYRGDGGR